MMTPKELITRIETEINSKNFDVSSFCEEVGINRGTFYNMKTRGTFPSLETFFNICKALNISPDDLLNLDSKSVLSSLTASQYELVTELKRLYPKITDALLTLIKNFK